MPPCSQTMPANPTGPRVALTQSRQSRSVTLGRGVARPIQFKKEQETQPGTPGRRSRAVSKPQPMEPGSSMAAVSEHSSGRSSALRDARRKHRDARTVMLLDEPSARAERVERECQGVGSPVHGGAAVWCAFGLKPFNGDMPDFAFGLRLTGFAGNGCR